MLTPLQTTSSFLYYMFLVGSAWTERMIESCTTLSTNMPEIFALTVDTPSSPIDKQKPDLIPTLTDEFYTPLTSIRAASEILLDNPHLDLVQRQQFLSIILKESEKLTQVVNHTLILMEKLTK